MAYKIAATQLQGSSLDIINTIRANASPEYQSSIPTISTFDEIPKLGETMRGYPALANEFCSALMNRIGFTLARSAIANNPLSVFKKGELAFGETVEEVFIELAKATEFRPDKAGEREFKRTIPNVRTAFHAQNWKAQYPISVGRAELIRAFVSAEALTQFIEKVIGTLLNAATYDEYLLFKYLIIKGYNEGRFKVEVCDSTNLKAVGEKMRAISNKFQFISDKYNADGVHTSTSLGDQYILIDADFEAAYGINVLAGAFNRNEADYVAHRVLIDNFDEFDSERFTAVMADCDSMAAVTSGELTNMVNVKALVVDKEFFQVYTTLQEMTQTNVGSGLYQNFWYNYWGIFCTSPFSNAVAICDDAVSVTPPTTLTATLKAIDTNGDNTIYTIDAGHESALFVESEDMVEEGVAVHPYGVYFIPGHPTDVSYDPGDYIYVNYMGATYKGNMFKPVTSQGSTTYPAVGDTQTLTKQS